MATPFANTLTVWHALFLREALDRFFGGRAAWAWLVVEPAAHIIILGLIYSAMGRAIPNDADIIIWLSIGMLAYFLFRRTAVQTMHSVDCNKAFFAFRQVRPFDAALARGSVEAFSMFFVSLALLLPLAFFDKNIVPSDPLMLVAAFGSMWLLGLGYGLITAVFQRLVPETGHIFQIIMIPLYLASGVIMPFDILPPKFRDLLMINPLAHGVEIVRASFLENYTPLAGTSLLYVCEWVLGFIAFGLILFKLFETRLVMR